MIALVLLLACAAPAEIKVELSTFSALESAAHALAKGGRAEEFREVVSLMGQLGYAQDGATKLAAACEKELTGSKTRAKELPDACAKLEQAAGELCLLLPKLAGEEQGRVARAVLRIDDTREEAHRALGHESSAGGWVRPEERELLPRRTRILDVLQRAHEYEVEIQTEASTHDLLVAMHGGPGSVARWNGIAVHTPWSAERSARVLAETLRACAVSAFLLDGEQGLPPESWFARPRSVWVLTDSKKEYDTALAKALENQWIDAETFEQSKSLVGFVDRRGNGVSYAPSEAENEAALLCWLAPLQDGPMSALKAGHLSYVCQAYLGTPLPGFAWRVDPHEREQTFVKPGADELKEREKRLGVAKAGLPGARSWMSWCARRRADPAYARCWVDFFGKLTGEELLKATSMAEYLQERGELRPLLDALRETISSKAYEACLRTLNETAPALELRWRDWVVRDEPSLCARLGKSAAPLAPGTQAEELRAALSQLRQKVLPVTLKVAPLELDATLSAGCAAHAAYLELNKGQVPRWPEVHSEYPDRPGFSAQGAWAGAHSLVGSAQDARATLDVWMATFYHRVPLLDPGLLRVGYGSSSSLVVVDVHSLRQPPESSWAVVWPHEEMQKVPLKAEDELPSPVPQAEAGSLGYPITLQVGLPELGDPPLAIEMRLFEGDQPVECWFSSPEKPLNPRLVPPRSFALFPKRPLKAGTRYLATAEWTGTARKKTWFFRT